MIRLVRTRAGLLLSAIGIAALSSGFVGAGEPAPDLPPIRYAATPEGEVIESHGTERAFNPASALKMATTLWALEILGPDHRYETGFAIRGALDPSSGTVDGDLVVLGGGDPDFHVENVFLVAEALSELGIRNVAGKLRIGGEFSIGWEGGSERRLRDADARRGLMGRRLQDALDTSSWEPDLRKAFASFSGRRQATEAIPSSVAVAGNVEAAGGVADAAAVVHRGNPLSLTLKRLNSWSNNDIERLGDALGTPSDLQRFLIGRWGPEAGRLEVSTLSGLGVNRISAGTLVHLVGDLRDTARRLGLELRDLLPAAGCDPGTLAGFATLSSPPYAGSVVAKTGSLKTTDGGVAVLAGVASTASGPVLFCAATPRSGSALGRARARQERWLVDLIQRRGGPKSRPCGPEPSFSDERAVVTTYPANASVGLTPPGAGSRR